MAGGEPSESRDIGFQDGNASCTLRAATATTSLLGQLDQTAVFD